MKLNVNVAQSIEVNNNVFDAKYNETLIHQAVVAFMAGARQGTRAQKTRAEVSGGVKKPWRQKGTGRARAGSTRSPIWRSGGTTFAAKPQDHSQKINRKMYRAAIRSIFSELVRTDRLLVVESFAVDAPKTKELITKLQSLDLKDVLIVTDTFDTNLWLAARNLPNVDYIEANNSDPVSLIAYEKVLITVPAIKKIEEVLA